jgi:hypothetical protein
LGGLQTNAARGGACATSSVVVEVVKRMPDLVQVSTSLLLYCCFTAALLEVLKRMADLVQVRASVLVCPHTATNVLLVYAALSY